MTGIKENEDVIQSHEGLKLSPRPWDGVYPGLPTFGDVDH